MRSEFDTFGWRQCFEQFFQVPLLLIGTGLSRISCVPWNCQHAADSLADSVNFRRDTECRQLMRRRDGAVPS
jgi:hypothetical protein